MEYLKKAPLSSASDRLVIQQTVSEIPFQVESPSGVTLGQKQIPVNAVGWSPETA
jgi:hypothetical protein